ATPKKLMRPAGTRRSEEFQADAEHLLHLADRISECEHDDAVLGPDTHPAIGFQDLAVTEDGAEAQAFRQVQFAQRRADQRRGLQRLGLDHLRRAMLNTVDGPYPPPAYMLQHLRNRHV